MRNAYYLTGRVPAAAALGCPPLGLKFPTTAADEEVMEERRSEARMLCADMIEVSWSDGPGWTCSASVLLEDISPSGACLQLDKPVPLGARISWTSSGHEYRGSVRYCVYREIGYFVGVEFTPGLKWSRAEFEPQHLLDLKKLMG